MDTKTTKQIELDLIDEFIWLILEQDQDTMIKRWTVTNWLEKQKEIIIKW